MPNLSHTFFWKPAIRSHSHGKLQKPNFGTLVLTSTVHDDRTAFGWRVLYFCRDWKNGWFMSWRRVLHKLSFKLGKFRWKYFGRHVSTVDETPLLRRFISIAMCFFHFFTNHGGRNEQRGTEHLRDKQPGSELMKKKQPRTELVNKTEHAPRTDIRYLIKKYEHPHNVFHCCWTRSFSIVLIT